MGTRWVRPYAELMQMAEELRRKAIAVSVELARTEAEGKGRDSPGHGMMVQQAVARARKAAEAAFAGIPAQFQPFSQMPDPAAFAAPIDALHQAVGGLTTTQATQDPLNHEMPGTHPEFAQISTASDYLAEWDGDAARAFKQNFLDPFPFHTAAQFNIAAVLRGAVEAERAIWHAARLDVAAIAQEGIEALDRLGDCGKNEWTIGYTVVAAVAFVAGAALAPLTAGGSLALVAVGSAASVAAVVPPEDPEPIQFSGETPPQVVDEVMRGLSELVNRVGQQEAKIASAMYTDYSIVLENWSSFVSLRPALADATPATIATDAYLGRPD